MNNMDEGNESAVVRLPRHIAIIMDGNNRWARARGERGAIGHRAGAEVARDLVFSCADKGIEYLTLFAFSSENWLRPKKEVLGLMALFLSVLQRQEVQMMHKRNVRLKFIGNRTSFSRRLQKHMQDVEELTRENTGLVVTVAADYGGRWDICQATAAIARAAAQGQIDPAAIDAATMQKYLSMNDVPDPDLCIRTGGEQRISNFLLWQFAYTELYFTECYWPDFDTQQFELALDDFSGRKRRFGRESGTDERL
jgi:undecaprenyl diphosphate synthase